MNKEKKKERNHSSCIWGAIHMPCNRSPAGGTCFVQIPPPVIASLAKQVPA